MVDRSPVTTWSAMVSAAYRDAGTVLVAEDRRWSGPELLELASGAADWVTSLQLPPGVALPALLGQTSLAALALSIAGAALGHPLAPLEPRLTPRELVPAVAGLGSPVLLAEPQAVEVAGRVAVGTHGRAVIIPEFAPSRRALPEPAPDAIAAHLHTSGTTGAPKAVPMRQDRLLARARVNIDLLKLDGDSVYATASPWHHIAGMGNVVVAMAAGAAVVAAPRFSVESWTQLQKHGPTHWLLVPSMIEMLLEVDAVRPGTTRVLQYGASPIHPDTLHRVLATLPHVDLINMFGQTEGSPITCLDAEDHRRAATDGPHLLRSVGRPAPGVELHIDDPGEDGVGEVLARADHFMRVGADGWLRTGDMGRLDADGYLFLSGRVGDKIVRGGENIFPVEIEHVLTTHPAIAEAGVVGVPDRRLGEAVAAFLVLTDPAGAPSIDELRAFARERLAGFKVPSQWRFVEALPKTPSGKVQRARLLLG